MKGMRKTKGNGAERNEVLYSKGERDKILKDMEQVAATFYTGAVGTRCHPFIEFCGLMSEYQKICQHASNQGIDFTQANTHTGQALPMETFHAEYLAEKLNCIYGPSLLENADVRNTFISTLFDGKFKLVPVTEARASEKTGSTNVYHDHLDVCKQCADQPFNLCPTGAKKLKEAAGFAD